MGFWRSNAAKFTALRQDYGKFTARLRLYGTNGTGKRHHAKLFRLNWKNRHRQKISPLILFNIRFFFLLCSLFEQGRWVGSLPLPLIVFLWNTQTQFISNPCNVSFSFTRSLVSFSLAQTHTHTLSPPTTPHTHSLSLSCYSTHTQSLSPATPHTLSFSPHSRS